MAKIRMENSVTAGSVRFFLTRTKFNPQAVAKLLAAVRDFLAMAERRRLSVGLDEVLSAEAAVFGELGVREMNGNLNQLRARALSFLPAEARVVYAGLLLLLANTHYRNRDFQAARNILELVKQNAPRNCHVKLCLAEVAAQLDGPEGVLGHLDDAWALMTSGKSDERVSVGDVWLAEAREARARVNMLKPGDNLAWILDPVFAGAAKFQRFRDFYSDFLDQVLGDLAGKPAAQLEAMARYFGRGIEGESTREVGQLKGLGKIPDRLYRAVACIGSSATTGEIFEAFDRIEAGLGGIASAIHIFVMAEAEFYDLQREGMGHARELLEAAAGAGHIDPGKAELLGNCLAIMSREKEAANLVEELTQFRKMALEAEAKDSAVQIDCESLLQRFRHIYSGLDQAESAEARTCLCEEMRALIGSLPIPANLETVIRLADGVFGLDAGLDDNLTMLFGFALAEPGRRAVYAAKLREAYAAATGEGLFDRAFVEAAFNLFFVRLRAMPQMTEVFREISGCAYAKPVSLPSLRLFKLASAAPDWGEKQRLYEAALAADENNMPACLGLACCHLVAGRLADQKALMRKVFEQSATPQTLLQVCRTQAEGVKALSREVGSERLTAARELFVFARDAVREIDLADQQNEALRGQWLEMLEIYIGFFKATQDYQSAIECCDGILAYQPENKKVATEKGWLFFLNGEFSGLNDYSAGLGRGHPSLPLRTFYFEAQFLATTGEADLSRLLREISADGSVESSLDLGLLRIEFLINLRRIGEAKKLLKPIQARVAKETDGQKSSSSAKKYRGMLKVVEAKFFCAADKIESSFRPFREAIELFSGDFSLQQYEVDARVALLVAMNKSAELIPDMNDQAINAAMELNDRYRSFPSGHLLILTPLLRKKDYRSAVVHIRWLIDNSFMFSETVLGNLILLATKKFGRSYTLAPASDALQALKDRIGLESFRQRMEEALNHIRTYKPDFEVDDSLRAMLEETIPA